MNIGCKAASLGEIPTLERQGQNIPNAPAPLSGGEFSQGGLTMNATLNKEFNQKLFTLTGLSLEEAIRKLDEELPEDAYKPVPGAVELTDISPAHMRNVLNSVFGLCGLGWGYSFEATDVSVEQDGNRYVAILKKMVFWYKVIYEDGTLGTATVESTGASENFQPAYALKGALTSALSGAVSNIGFQESVYMGRRSHRTVVNGGSGNGTPAPAAPHPRLQPRTGEEDTVDYVDDFIVPSVFKKHGGMRLSDLPRKSLEWYANEMAATSEAAKAFQAAARAYLARHPA